MKNWKLFFYDQEQDKNAYVNTFFQLSAGDLPDGTVDKNLPASAGHMGSIPGLGRFHTLQSM